MNTRRLTEKEIDLILKGFDIIEYVGIANAELLREGYKNETRKILEQAKLLPKRIPDYGARLLRKYVDSRLPGGIMLGSICAEALTRDLTQESLDGKKNTGLSKNKISYLDIFKDITSYRPTKDAKEVTSVVYFKDGLNNFSYILDKGTEILQLTLKTLAMEIIGPEDPKLYFDPGRHTPPNDKSWYDLYFDSHNTSDSSRAHIEKTEWFIRIQIKTKLLFKYRITPGDVCDALQASSTINLFECIPSPILPDGSCYIDIYPIKDQIQKASRKEGKVKSHTSTLDSRVSILTKIFLTNVFVEELNNYVIKGIKKIYGYSADWKDSNYGFGVSTEYPGKKNTWKFWLNFGWLYSNNLDENFYLDIFKFLKIKHTYDAKNSYIVIYGKKNPTKILTERFSAIKKDQMDDIKRRIKKKKNLITKGKKLEASKVSLVPTGYSNLENSVFRSFYVSLDGTNLAHLFMIREINTNRTFSNDLHETYEFFGIDMVRDLMVTRLNLIFQSAGIWIEPNFFTLLADYMCFYGKPIKIGHYGAVKRGDDIMVQATLKNPDSIIAKTALFGGTSSVHTSVGMTMTGQVSMLGLPEPKDDKTDMEKELEVETKLENIDLDTDTILNMIESFKNTDQSVADNEDDLNNTDIDLIDDSDEDSDEEDLDDVEAGEDLGPEPPSIDPSVMGTSVLKSLENMMSIAGCPVDYSEYEYVLENEDGHIIEEEIIYIEDK